LDGLIDNDAGEPLVQHAATPGHAIAHRSTERHGGGPTKVVTSSCAPPHGGIREILVLFLTTRQENRAPPVERSFYLKEMARASPSIRLTCYQLAAQENPLDAEAHFWAGFYNMLEEDNPDYHGINRGIRYLETAATLCPTDARTLSYLGSAYSRRWNHVQEFGISSDLVEEEEMEKTVLALKRAVYLEDVCSHIGCNEDMNVAAALLTLGEIFVYKQDYRQAIQYLQAIEHKLHGCPNNVRDSILGDAVTLMNECRKIIDK
jgi:tetratricopeptide (TPR) repeat protein